MATSQHFQWAIIGGGPAGIAAVGKLIDFGVSPEQIAWIDPAFQVGDFGTQWRNVPSNTKAELFQKFLAASPAFQFNSTEHQFALYQADPEKTCLLSLMADPLQWITDQLRQRVTAIEGMVQQLNVHEGYWQVALTDKKILAHKVVLAIGSEPKRLSLKGPQEIPLQVAMNPAVLHQAYTKEDVVAVFGSSHSAILTIRNLVEAGVKQVINFYLSPLRYAVYFDDWILFDDTGLKGTTADWAREHIDGQLPPNLLRLYSSPEHIAEYLPQCQKVIYSIGFARRTTIQVDDFADLKYDDKTGIIAPGLFGLGIAFPEGKVDRMGNLEYRVGLWKFMDYATRVVPLWLQYGL